MRILPPILAALVALPAAAQEPTHVPMEFIEKLVLSPYGPEPRALVGQLPDRLTELLRPGAAVRIIGTMDYRVITSSAVIVPGAPDAVREEWSARLSGAGWTVPPMREMMAPRRGFMAQDGAPEQRRDEDRGWCSPDRGELIRLHTDAHTGDSTAVLIMHAEGETASACRRETPQPSMLVELPIPTLVTPAGASLRGAGSGGGGDDGHAEARLGSDLSLAELGAHYAAEMQREGWSAGDPALGDDVAAQPFRRRDEQNREWLGVLTITRISPSLSDLYLRLVLLRD